MKLSRTKNPKGLLSDLEENFPWDLGLRRETNRARWVPRTDVYATDEAYVFEMDLPGVDRENVEIALEDSKLTISGERTRDVREDDEGEDGRVYHRVERQDGSFERSYVLPDGVDADAITADYEEGTLRITVPMPEENGQDRRRIEIN